MRLRSMLAENMLSFGRLDLKLQDGLNVLVGPNDSGKTNVFRLVDLLRQAAITRPNETFALDSAEIEQLVRHGASEGYLALGIELTEASELETMNTFIRAVAARLIEAPDANRLLAASYEGRSALRQAIVDYVHNRLYVAAHNTAAVGLYRSLGFTTFRTDAALILDRATAS